MREQAYQFMANFKYSKSSAGYLLHKTYLLDKNKQNLEKNDVIAALYRKQPLRTQCKNCEAHFPPQSTPDFTSHSIDYYFCRNCEHLNGMHQDTAEFANALYADSEEINYHETYTADDTDVYQSRVADIYLPKVDFLLEAVGSEDKTTNIEVLDIGSGAGHFVEALRSRNIPVRGLEISGKAVNYGNRMMGEDILCQVEYEELLSEISTSRASVATMIGVLEHLANPREVLAAIEGNSNIKYLYLLLPVVSLAVFLEMFFQDSFNRLLGGGHTHLYSRKSIAHILNEFDFDSISEWWFGADIPDLIRFGQIELGRASASDYVKDLWGQKFRGICDKLQSVIDREHFCSEIHIVAKKRAF